MTSITNLSEAIQPPTLPNFNGSWRADAAQALADAGMEKDALDFLNCGREFWVSTCNLNIGHPAELYPLTCHKRFCQDCEHREQARKLARYIPAIFDMIAVDRKGYRLRKIELTTPYALGDQDAPERYEIAWKAVQRVLELLFYRQLEHAGKLSPSEIRRGRADLKKHDIGALVGSEFGEQGHKLHFHMLTYCMYIDQKVLADTWREVTQGECEVVWIKEIKHEGVEKAVNEVAKYVTKFTELPPSLVPQLARVIKGHRRIRTFGSMFGIGSVPGEPHVCEECGASKRHVSILTYFNRCVLAGIPPHDEILAAHVSLLNLKPGNKSGEKYVPNLAAIPPPDD